MLTRLTLETIVLLLTREKEEDHLKHLSSFYLFCNLIKFKSFRLKKLSYRQFLFNAINVRNGEKSQISSAVSYLQTSNLNVVNSMTLDWYAPQNSSRGNSLALNVPILIAYKSQCNKGGEEDSSLLYQDRNH